MPQFIKPSDTSSLQVCSDVIKDGGIVALATDTLYGIACDATNDSAVKKLYVIKARDSKKPISISLSDCAIMKEYVKLDKYTGLVNELLPGPFTFIFEIQESSKLSKLLNPNANNIGVRIPDEQFIIDLAKDVGVPLALTSANLSGQKSPLVVEDFQEIWPKIDLIVDSGEIKQDERAGSTIVQLTSKTDFSIVREGVAAGQFQSAWKNFEKMILNINNVHICNQGENVSQASGY